MQVDPLAGKYPGWSPYNYSLGNPLRYIDPTGQCPEEPEKEGCNITSNIIESLRVRLNENRFNYVMGLIFHGGEQLNKNVDFAGEKLKETGLDLAESAVKGGILIADFTSDASTVVAAGGLSASPFTKGASLTITGGALAIGAGADLTSLGLKAIDYAAFDGSGEALVTQGVVTGTRLVGGRLVQSATSKVVTRTGPSVVGPFFRSGQTGQFVTNSYGYAVTAASDATRVSVNLIVPMIHDTVKGK